MKSAVTVVLCVISMFISHAHGAGEKKIVESNTGIKLKVGVFDRQATEGSGPSIGGLVRGLIKNGYEAQAISDFEKLTLLQYDIIYLCNVTSVGMVRPSWKKNLRNYVREGGSLIQTWRQASPGGIQIISGHQAVKGLSTLKENANKAPLENDMGDENSTTVKKGKQNRNFVPAYGKKFKVLIKDNASQAVAVAYQFGKGKIIVTGMNLNISKNGRATLWPKGSNESVIKAFIEWLKPRISKEVRIAKALASPSILMTRYKMNTAAGFFPNFSVRIATGNSRGKIELSCPNDPDIVLEKETSVELVQGRNGTLESYKVSGQIEKSKDAVREILFRAKIGSQVVEETVKITSTYGGPGVLGEQRGLWTWPKNVPDPQKSFPRFKKMGINLVIPQISHGVTAFYPDSTVQFVYKAVPGYAGSDWLVQAIESARANDMKIIPYIGVFSLSSLTRRHPDIFKKLEKEGRVVIGSRGESVAWLCPTHEGNIQHIEDVVAEIATKYKVDGVQLDVIRYRDKNGCYCGRCRDVFEMQLGNTLANWPGDVINGEYVSQWLEFRRECISNVVQRVSKRIRKDAPGVKLSAAVFSGWPNCRDAVGQDWSRWCQEGWLDSVEPMTYTTSSRLFNGYSKSHHEALPEGFPVRQGMGVTSAAGWIQYPSQLAHHIALARKNKASGWVLWRYNKSTDQMLEALAPWINQK